MYGYLCSRFWGERDFTKRGQVASGAWSAFVRSTDVPHRGCVSESLLRLGFFRFTTSESIVSFRCWILIDACCSVMSTKRSLKDKHGDDGSSSKTIGMNNKTPFVPSVEYLTGQVDVLQAQVKNLTTEKELLLVENAQLKTHQQVQEKRVQELEAHQEVSKQANDRLGQTVQELSGKIQRTTEEKDALLAQVGQLMQQVDTTNQNQAGSATNYHPNFAPEKGIWKSTGSTEAYGPHDWKTRPMVDVLNGPLPKEGVHKWKISICTDNENGPLRLGVVASWFGTQAGDDFAQKLGDCGGGSWGYEASTGYAWYGKRNIGGRHPAFWENGEVTFCLDLRGNGTLSATLGGNQPFIELFSNMKAVADQFVPAAYLPRGAELQFHGFLH